MHFPPNWLSVTCTFRRRTLDVQFGIKKSLFIKFVAKYAVNIWPKTIVLAFFCHSDEFSFTSFKESKIYRLCMCVTTILADSAYVKNKPILRLDCVFHDTRHWGVYPQHTFRILKVLDHLHLYHYSCNRLLSMILLHEQLVSLKLKTNFAVEIYMGGMFSRPRVL